MAETIHQVDYYHVEVPDKAGEGFRILTGLEQAGVNLLACCGFPSEVGKVQLDLVPENSESFRKVAASLKLKLSDPKKAFLIQGQDRVGAVAQTLAKLAREKINLVAAQALAAGGGRWAMLLWVKPADYLRASKALHS